MITEKGFDLSFMLRKGKLRKRNYAKVYEAYTNILNEVKGMNYEILAAYVKWQASFIKFRAEHLKSKLDKNYKSAKIEIENDFNSYLDLLNKNFTDFEITEYYFTEDFEEIYKKMSDKVPHENFKKFIGIKFYDWFEYQLFLNENPEIMFLGYLESFNKLFIKQRTIKLKDIKELDRHLSDLYSKNGKYFEYQIKRTQLFDIDKLKYRTKEKISGFTEVSRISKILGFNIDTKKTTLAEYEAHRDTAQEIAKQLETKADGGV